MPESAEFAIYSLPRVYSAFFYYYYISICALPGTVFRNVSNSRNVTDMYVRTICMHLIIIPRRWLWK